MSLIPEIYRNTDPSAPACSGVTGSLTTLLDAVLVNGYGAKAGLGWSIVDSGTNWRVYRHNPVSGTGMYLYVNDAAAGSGGAREALVRGYQTWDPATDSGTLPFPTVAQMSGGIVWKKSNTADSTARPWMVIGNERCFYLFMDCNSGLRQVYFAGDTKSYKPGDARHYLVSGGMTQNVSIGSVISYTLLTGAGISAFSTSYTTGYLAANAAATTNSVKATSQAADQMNLGHTFCFGSTINSNRPYPGVVSGGLDVSRIMLYEANYAERGEWPGVYQPLHGMPLVDQTLYPAAGPDLVDLLAVSYRRAVTGNAANDDGQLLFEVGVEW